MSRLTELQMKEAARLQVFQLQAELISMDASDSTLQDARDWLTPMQYTKVVDERSFISLCGRPGCNNNINPRYLMKDNFYSAKEKERDKKPQSSLFCCVKCEDISEIYKNSLDPIDSVERDIARTLSFDPGSGTDLGELMESGEEEKLSVQQQSSNYNISRMASSKPTAPEVVKRPIDGRVPPLYKPSNPALTNNGRINASLIPVIPIGTVVVSSASSPAAAKAPTPTVSSPPMQTEPVTRQNISTIIRLNNSGPPSVAKSSGQSTSMAKATAAANKLKEKDSPVAILEMLSKKMSEGKEAKENFEQKLKMESKRVSLESEAALAMEREKQYPNHKTNQRNKLKGGSPGADEGSTTEVTASDLKASQLKEVMDRFGVRDADHPALKQVIVKAPVAKSLIPLYNPENNRDDSDDDVQRKLKTTPQKDRNQSLPNISPDPADNSYISDSDDDLDSDGLQRLKPSSGASISDKRSDKYDDGIYGFSGGAHFDTIPSDLITDKGKDSSNSDDILAATNLFGPLSTGRSGLSDRTGTSSTGMTARSDDRSINMHIYGLEQQQHNTGLTRISKNELRKSKPEIAPLSTQSGDATPSKSPAADFHLESEGSGSSATNVKTSLVPISPELKTIKTNSNHNNDTTATASDLLAVNPPKPKQLLPLKEENASTSKYGQFAKPINDARGKQEASNLKNALLGKLQPPKVSLNPPATTSIASIASDINTTATSSNPVTDSVQVSKPPLAPPKNRIYGPGNRPLGKPLFKSRLIRQELGQEGSALDSFEEKENKVGYSYNPNNFDMSWRDTTTNSRIVDVIGGKQGGSSALATDATEVSDKVGGIDGANVDVDVDVNIQLKGRVGSLEAAEPDLEDSTEFEVLLDEKIEDFMDDSDDKYVVHKPGRAPKKEWSGGGFQPVKFVDISQILNSKDEEGEEDEDTEEGYEYVDADDADDGEGWKPL